MKALPIETFASVTQIFEFEDSEEIRVRLWKAEGAVRRVIITRKTSKYGPLSVKITGAKLKKDGSVGAAPFTEYGNAGMAPWLDELIALVPVPTLPEF